MAASLAQLSDGLAAARLAPFLGPDVLAVDGPVELPTSSRHLVAALTARIAVPGRLRSNLWAAAQWIESNKHRTSLVRALEQIFAAAPAPTRLHHWLASLDLPLIIDVWYDTMMADALTVSGKDFAQWQGVRRSGQRHEDPWGKAYDAAGHARADGDLAAVATLLHKPHGAVRPAANFLVSDSDYVEVLTEIDIQTPIPAEVIDRRGRLGFVFLGCRFHDQMERTFARQIIKRSAGPHVAVIEGELSKNEARFLEQEGITRIDMPLAEAVDALIGRG